MYQLSSQFFKRCDLNQKCVAIILCSDNSTINTDGALLIDERLDGPTDEIDIYDTLACPPTETCCGFEGIKPKVTKEQFNSKYPAHNKCGFRNKNGLGFKAQSMHNTSSYAHFGEFPWMVGIYNPIKKVPKMIGGGSLIHMKVVLSVRHILHSRDYRKFTLRAGDWDLRSLEKPAEVQERKVIKIVVHADFNVTAMYHNLVLYVAEQAFDMAGHINTVCLPPPDTSFVGQRCFASGWGKEEKMPWAQNYLKKRELPIVDQDNCNDIFHNRFAGDFVMNDDALCAGKFYFD